MTEVFLLKKGFSNIVKIDDLDHDLYAEKFVSCKTNAFIMYACILHVYILCVVSKFVYTILKTLFTVSW